MGDRSILQVIPKKKSSSERDKDKEEKRRATLAYIIKATEPRHPRRGAPLRAHAIRPVLPRFPRTKPILRSSHRSAGFLPFGLAFAI
jgi:hypothetical protein